MAIAVSSTVCGLAVLVVAVSASSRSENWQARLLRAYTLGFRTPFVRFDLLGSGLVAF